MNRIGSRELTSHSEVVHEHFLNVKRTDPRYSGFDEVAFDPELHDFSQTRLPYTENSDMTDVLVGLGAPSLAANFEDDVVPAVCHIWERHDIPNLLEKGSLTVAMNHAHFADSPTMIMAWIEAGVKFGVYKDRAEAARHYYSTISRFVDTLGTELTGGSVVQGGLRHISNVIRTLPNSKNGKLAGTIPTRVRGAHNNQVKKDLDAATAEAGNVIFVHPGASHDQLTHTDSGDVLRLQPLSRSNVRFLLGRTTLFCLVKSMPSFEAGKIVPDDQAFVEDAGLCEPVAGDSVHDTFGEMARRALPLFKRHGMSDLVSVEYVDPRSPTEE